MRKMQLHEEMHDYIVVPQAIEVINIMLHYQLNIEWYPKIGKHENWRSFVMKLKMPIQTDRSDGHDTPNNLWINYYWIHPSAVI